MACESASAEGDTEAHRGTAGAGAGTTGGQSSIPHLRSHSARRSGRELGVRAGVRLGF